MKKTTAFTVPRVTESDVSSDWAKSWGATKLGGLCDKHVVPLLPIYLPIKGEG
jgi:hypothetical protein